MSVNRIFCIGKNYAGHIAELAHVGHGAASRGSRPSKGAMSAPSGQMPLRAQTEPPSDDECVVFMKPASCIVEEGETIVLPRNRGAVHHEAELVIELTGGGRDIPETEALDCVAGMTLGLDLTLRELQTELKAQGKPWELAKAFDGSAPMGAVRPYLEQNLQDIFFSCHINGALRQQGHTRDMLFTVARQIHILSRTWALEPGDVLYTGTPEGVGPLKPGDEIVLSSPLLGEFRWSCT